MLVELKHNGVLLSCMNRLYVYGEKIHVRGTTEHVGVEVDVRIMRGLEQPFDLGSKSV